MRGFIGIVHDAETKAAFLTKFPIIHKLSLDILPKIMYHIYGYLCVPGEFTPFRKTMHIPS